MDMWSLNGLITEGAEQHKVPWIVTYKQTHSNLYHLQKQHMVQLLTHTDGLHGPILCTHQTMQADHQLSQLGIEKLYSEV